MIYAGIGARETPDNILKIMDSVASTLSSNGYTLRSGGAKGADTYFERGCGVKKEIFRPNGNIPDWAYKTVYKYHPRPMGMGDYAMRCHARNAQIMLGLNGDSPVDFVICWTKDGKASGGTGQAIRIAEDYGIQVYNLKNEEDLLHTLNYIKER